MCMNDIIRDFPRPKQRVLKLEIKHIGMLVKRKVICLPTKPKYRSSNLQKCCWHLRFKSINISDVDVEFELL